MARGFKPPHPPVKLHSEGTWDLTVYLPEAGSVVMVECKLPGGLLEPEQAEWGKIYRACGIETIVVSSAQQFLDEIEAIKKRRAVAL